MKYREINFKDMYLNIRHNIKLIATVIIVSVMLGVIVGMIDARAYEPEKDINISQLQQNINLEDIPKDGGYYYYAFYQLKEKKDYLNAYLQYFNQVDINSTSREKLAEIEQDIIEYEEMYNNAILFYEENAPTLYNKEELTIEFYSDQISLLIETKEKLERELNDVVSGRYTDNYKTSVQSKVSGRTNDINENIDLFNSQINIISSRTAEDQEMLSEANDILYNNVEYINRIVNDFNSTLESIAQEEQYEIIYNKMLINEYFSEKGFCGELTTNEIMNNQLGSAIVYAKSIAGLDIPTERFLTMLTFFSLCGCSLALIIGAVHNSEAGGNGNRK